MKKRKGHLSEDQLLAFCHNRLANPEELENHILICKSCLEQLEKMDALIEALKASENHALRPKHMKAGSGS